MDDTDKLIPISIIESILTDEETFLEFINQEGIFADINVLEYTTAINNYMSYILNNLRHITEEMLIKNNDERFQIIKQILSDDECFFKIGIDVAIDILESLEVENIYETYVKLIDANNYIKATGVRIID